MLSQELGTLIEIRADEIQIHDRYRYPDGCSAEVLWFQVNNTVIWVELVGNHGRKVMFDSSQKIKVYRKE
jgi:hypothetical protein